MGTEQIDPGRLTADGKYLDALRECDAQIAQGEKSWPVWAQRASALQCLGRLDEALADFRVAAKKVRTPAPDPGAYREEIATLEWLRGNYSIAVENLLFKVNGLVKGEIHYADYAGGVGTGVLLWFMGMRSGDDAARRQAEAFLKRRAKTKRIRHWPGHLGLFVLGRLAFEEVLRAAGNEVDPARVRAKAANDVLTRRQYCQAVFYEAAKRLEQGDRAGYTSGMRECCSLRNPIVENEWYIAQYEIGHLPAQRLVPSKRAKNPASARSRTRESERGRS